jgi:hypothetical protein
MRLNQITLRLLLIASFQIISCLGDFNSVPIEALDPPIDGVIVTPTSSPPQISVLENLPGEGVPLPFRIVKLLVTGRLIIHILQVKPPYNQSLV